MGPGCIPFICESCCKGHEPKQPTYNEEEGSWLVILFCAVALGIILLAITH
jgi:hypothetical protein